MEEDRKQGDMGMLIPHKAPTPTPVGTAGSSVPAGTVPSPAAIFINISYDRGFIHSETYMATNRLTWTFERAEIKRSFWSIM